MKWWLPGASRTSLVKLLVRRCGRQERQHCHLETSATLARGLTYLSGPRVCISTPCYGSERNRFRRAYRTDRACSHSTALRTDCTRTQRTPRFEWTAVFSHACFDMLHPCPAKSTISPRVVGLSTPTASRQIPHRPFKPPKNSPR